MTCEVHCEIIWAAEAFVMIFGNGNFVVFELHAIASSRDTSMKLSEVVLD
jgi:hypothetical protein